MVTLDSKISENLTSRSSRALVWVYGAWSFLASLLIFWIELMVARLLLPSFGGSPSVWNTALVFFQLNLLAGYAGAHILARLDSRKHKLIQSVLVVLPILTLPVALPAFLKTQGMVPTIAVLSSLTVMVGAPFFALSTSTPTLQAWFSRSSHPRSADPYFLYALSNVGSLVGLFGYPLVIERVLTLREQSVYWTVGYIIFALLCVAASRLVGNWSRSETKLNEKVPIRSRLRWAAIAFVPSLALLGVTQHISTDVAAFPLLWTVPLGLYLGSFVVTFRERGDRWRMTAQRVLRFLVVLTAVLAVMVNSAGLWLVVGLDLLLLAVVSIAGHGMVYASRPGPEGLTAFYLWVSIGGAVGGLFASVVAPMLFDSVVEYSLAVVLASLLVAGPIRSSNVDQRLLGLLAVLGIVVTSVVGDAGAQFAILGAVGVISILKLNRWWLAVVVATVFIITSYGSSEVLAVDRTFFGVYRVHETDEIRHLSHGTTRHGSQLLGGDGMTPISYYVEDGPMGDVFSSLGDRPLDVGITGLGVGGLAAYGDPGDTFTFYEIDPVVEDLAREYFTYLSNSEASVDVAIGDGRLLLEDLTPSHDLLILDAFTSDAVPVHLLTFEAFQLYLNSLSKDGVLVVHISNRHLRLEPVVGRIAQELGMDARVKTYMPGPEVEYGLGSQWVIIEKSGSLELPADWVAPSTNAPLWTDDYSNILSIVNWG